MPHDGRAGERGPRNGRSGARRDRLAGFRPPYDWPRLWHFLARRAVPGVETVSDGTCLRVIEYRGAHGVVTVRCHPRRRLVATVERAAALLADAPLATRLSTMFDAGAGALDDRSEPVA